MRKLSVAIVLSMLPVMASQAKATQIIASPTGIVDPHPTVTFDEHSFPLGTAISTQYRDLGLSFSPSMYYDNEAFGSLSGYDIKDAAPGTGYAVRTSFTVSFTNVVDAAVFSAGADGTHFTFTAMLNGNPIDSFTSVVGYDENTHFGFTNEKFDSIVITPLDTDNYLILDNFQLITPEPSGLVFLGTGLLGLVGVAKRRLA